MCYGMIEPDRRELLGLLRAVVPTDPKVPCEHWLLSGDPAQRIVELAEREHCDLIAMGTHGRSGFKRLLMGSVAEAVMRRANCAVLTFKDPCTKPNPPRPCPPRETTSVWHVGTIRGLAAAAESAGHGTPTAA
jgi:hypothetical protein